MSALACPGSAIARTQPPPRPRLGEVGFGFAVATLVLAAGGGCAQIKKNVSQPHPMEHQFGHMMFNETRHARFPTLAPAAPRERETPRRPAEGEGAAGQDPAAHASGPGSPADAGSKQQVGDTAAQADAAADSVQPPEEAAARPGGRPDGAAAIPPVPVPPKAPKPTADRGLDIAEAPGPDAPAGRLGDGSYSGEVLAAAQRLVGISQNFDEQGMVTHLLQSADYPLQAAAGQDLVKALYEDLAARRATFAPSHKPSAGDIVFFHNTYDRDKDSRADDWFTMAGVVESVGGDGTVTFIGYARGAIRRMYVNVERPSVRRNEAAGTELNSMVRAKELSDRPFTSYLAGELFASYGRLGPTAGDSGAGGASAPPSGTVAPDLEPAPARRAPEAPAAGAEPGPPPAPGPEAPPELETEPAPETEPEPEQDGVPPEIPPGDRDAI